MKLSTRSRYGLRFMVELALHSTKDKLLILKDAAKNQGISEKYLSKLVISLKKAGLIIVERGATGGFRLAKPPENINILEIIEALEGDISPVQCVNLSGKCTRKDICTTRPLWCELDSLIKDFLHNKKLSDVLSSPHNEDHFVNMFYI